jgi:DNA-binding NtrC family response regulator
MKILIVDDEKTILEEVAETLTDEGYECFIASNVETAVEIATNTPEITLILTDLRMPKKTGADLIKIIEMGFGKQIKFIVMSGHASPGVEANGIDVALYPFLKKPLDIETLTAMVASVLDVKE